MTRLRIVLVAALWLLGTKLALDRGPALLPESVARRLSLQSFLTLTQVLTTALGLGLAALVLRAPREDLGLRGVRARQLGWSVLAAPLVFVFALAAGIGIALPTLLAEIARGGAAVSRENTGAFGRAVEQSSLLLTVLWAGVVAPVAEELLFRGAVWGAIQRLVAPREGAPAHEAEPSSLPPELIDDGVVVKAVRWLGTGLRGGGFATLGSAAVFGAMHLGMAGGSGIVRVVSAVCLGLACGTARHLTRGLGAPVALHVTYNLISIGHARGWLVSAAFPSRYGVPTLMLWISAVAAMALAAAAILGKRGVRANVGG